ncbi:hypothetical protein ACN3XK_50305 [Actinomadura welshii]
MAAHEQTITTSRTIAPRLLAGAIGFLVLYLSVSFIPPALATGSLPLPDDPASETRAWYADNAAAVVATAALQALSVSFLAVFVHALGRAAAKARPWGHGAVAAMLVSSTLSLILAATASSASLDTVSALRTANFIAGGTAHVAALGIFVLLASRMPGFGKGVRGFAWVVAVPSVASLISLAVFEGAALILLGRLLAMLWTITAAIALTRRLRTP